MFVPVRSVNGSNRAKFLGNHQVHIVSHRQKDILAGRQLFTEGEEEEERWHNNGGGGFLHPGVQPTVQQQRTQGRHWQDWVWSPGWSPPDNCLALPPAACRTQIYRTLALREIGSSLDNSSRIRSVPMICFFFKKI